MVMYKEPFDKRACEAKKWAPLVSRRCCDTAKVSYCFTIIQLLVLPIKPRELHARLSKSILQKFTSDSAPKVNRIVLRNGENVIDIVTGSHDRLCPMGICLVYVIYNPKFYM